MIPFLESLLAEFKGCFSRKAAWRWFVIIILGLLTRSDHLGVTSVIRALSLDGKHYESLIKFFRSSAYGLGDVKRVRWSVIAKSGKRLRVCDSVLLLGDGTKSFFNMW